MPHLVLFTMTTHYTATKQSGSAFYLFRVVQETVSGHEQKMSNLSVP